MRYYLVLSFLAVLSFSSCRYKLISDKKNQNVLLQESIARLACIPDVPLGVQVQSVIKAEQDPDSVQLFCRYGAVAQKYLKSFYIEEMERIGWKLLSEHDGEEVLLLFEKPSGAVCSVSIRDNKKLVVTLLYKK